MAGTYDTIILGAGAAGLFCGAQTARRGRRTLVLDHAAKLAEKIRISGGGRCNFTNLETVPARFLSENPHFAKSALARYTPWDFCDLMARHGLTWHEKTLGQLFCDQRSSAVINMLLSELETPGGELRLACSIETVKRAGAGFELETSDGPLACETLVIATGGLSIPKIGASRFAYDLAERFGHEIVTPRPALVPLTFSGALKDAFAELSGVSTPVEARAGDGPGFAEAMLFTHRGLSGPAILQASSYWQTSSPVEIDLFPGADALDLLTALKEAHPRRSLAAALSEHLPKRLAAHVAGWPEAAGPDQLAQWPASALQKLASKLKSWRFTPAGTEGWRTAEVTAGGIDTKAISSKTMESQLVPGLYFIGECVDVTGWLGGYNFQWAWASAAAAGAVA